MGTPTPLASLGPRAPLIAPDPKQAQDEEQYDNGCSDIRDSPDVASFLDGEDDNSCGCDDALGLQDDPTIFDLEINDLDLEQIEKH